MDTYYTNQRSRLIGFYNLIVKQIRPYMASAYGDELAAKIISEARQEFEAILPAIPYVGGMKNVFTPILIFTGLWIALYRVMAQYGKSAEEMAVMFYRAFEAILDKPPEAISGLMGRVMLGKHGVASILRRQAERSQKRRYPDDWVFTVTEGDGETFDWEMTFTECAVIKFLKQQHAEALMPYCNFGDILMSKTWGMGMQGHSIGEGCKTCVEQFKLGRETQTRAWIP